MRYCRRFGIVLTLILYVGSGLAVESSTSALFDLWKLRGGAGSPLGRSADRKVVFTETAERRTAEGSPSMSRQIATYASRTALCSSISPSLFLPLYYFLILYRRPVPIHFFLIPYYQFHLPHFLNVLNNISVPLTVTSISILRLHTTNCISFEVLTAVTMKNPVFWDVRACGSCDNIAFLSSVIRLLVTANVVPILMILVTLIM
jgi:hypothetical protein